MNKLIDNKKVSNYASYFLCICIFVGVILHIVPYIYNRSLWIDEAMLASSICTRTFGELVSSPLDWGQSASVGWLFIVKFITILFGTSETTLRIWSLITGLGCICSIYLLLKDTVKRNYALFITAIFSLTDRYIYYGNEVKPYMSDNLCCLITLLLWQKYKLKKINLLQLAIAYSVIIWFSFSAVFFVAACMIIECFQLFVEMVKNKDLSVIKKLCICLIVLVSFVINYVLWLSKTSDNAGGANYWALLRFPLIPTSLSDIKLVIKMALQFWNFYTYYIVAIFIFLLLIYFVICIKNKEDKSNLVVPFILSLLILFVASYLGFYPIQDRLVQVYAIVALVIVGYSCNDMDLSRQNNDMIYEIDWIKLFYYGLLTGCLAIVGMGGCKNLFANHVYKSGSEVSESIEYIEENMTDTDMLYVFRYSIPVYTYETGYQISYTDLKPLSEDKKNMNESLILPCQIGNTIYGQSLVTYLYQTAYSYENKNNMTAILEDAELISKNDSVYIFASHGEAGLSGLMEELEKYGTIEMVVDYYNTHLYHFVRSNA